MSPAIDYEELIDRLTERFKYRYEGDPSTRTRMVGVVFARPNSPLAKSEIIPQLNDWHFRSGEHIDFYFVGYTYPHPPAEKKSGQVLQDSIAMFQDLPPTLKLSDSRRDDRLLIAMSFITLSAG